MNRRSFFESFAAAGAAGAMMASSRSVAAQAKPEGRPSGPWPDWPFEESHIPYRERAGKVRWPNNGPLCVYMYVTGEWVWNRPYSNPDRAIQKRNLSIESDVDQYTFTVGIWRAIKLLDKFDLKISIFPSASMVEHYPDLFRELHSKGHEIICRSYDQGKGTQEFTPAGEQQEIQRCTAIVENVIGKRPLGWDNPGGYTTPTTPGILTDLGYRWMGGLKGDDLPYGIKTSNGKKIVVLPSRHKNTSDQGIFPQPDGSRSGREALEYFKDFFDSFYKLGQEEYPGALSWGIHPFRSMTPDRYGVMERALEYMRKYNDVWFARCDELAEWWWKNYMDMDV